MDFVGIIMSEINYVVDKLEVKFEGIFSLDDLYNTLKEFLEQSRYTVTEKAFEEKTKESLVVKWKSVKIMDEYTQFVIKSTIKCNGELIEVKKKQLYQGSLTLTLKSQIEKDFQDIWVGPVKRFIRGVYDKFIASQNFERLEHELKDDTFAVAEKARHYLNMKKFRER